MFYLFLRERQTERQSMSRGGSKREGDTESEAGSRLWAVTIESDARLELTDPEITTWAEVRRWTKRATQAPLRECSLNKYFSANEIGKGQKYTRWRCNIGRLELTCQEKNYTCLCLHRRASDQEWWGKTRRKTSALPTVPGRTGSAVRYQKNNNLWLVDHAHVCKALAARRYFSI